jgi:hypothetical protein
MIYSFSNTDQILVAKLRGRGPILIKALSNKLNNLGLRLQSKIRTEKLEGGTPLHRRSGELSRSVQFFPTEASGSRLEMRVEAAGATAFYGRIHERGGRGTYEIVPKNKQALAFGAGEFAVPLRGGGVASKYQILKALSSRTESTHAYGARLARRAPMAEFEGGQMTSSGMVVVKKVVHPPLPARPFMKPAYEEMRPTIVSELQQTTNEALKG